ncbi:four-carbon acid sugar kinase family protein [Bacillus weihaiensis]|uniref:Hrp-dependent type III effector protein n=1 Tax=Bacillus weihaiensis TaxID=1547283 RepID=A0A1L3MTY4_9BACI|nr:four-carbon acid sugar kinase family protein [Bacillus weihaiensis]APH05793.1 hypothetical protein A9C19_14215 [Bacillus weihaiensis]
MDKRIGIIADDLTGANDSGVQLAKKGFSTTVMIDINGLVQSTVGEGTEVLVIDSDSRAMDPCKACERTAMAASFLLEEKYTYLYKKVDSTLRGNIAAELKEAVAIYQPEIVVFAPAFPQLNRTTKNGNHFVHNVLLHETEFAHDPKTPVATSSIPDLLQSEVDEELFLLNIAAIRSSHEEGINTIKKALLASRWFICDAETEADLVKIVRLFANFSERILWSGSGGLIDYIPEVLGLSPGKKNGYEQHEINKILTVSGSLSQNTQQQIKRLRTEEDCAVIELNPVELLTKTFTSTDILEKLNGRKEKHLVLYLDNSGENRREAKLTGAMLGYDHHQVSERLSGELGLIVASIIEKEEEINGFILTGGDTAKSVCSALGVTTLSLISEIEPGLPFGKINTGERTFWTVTKAGGFGNEDALVSALKFMTREGDQDGK